MKKSNDNRNNNNDCKASSNISNIKSCISKDFEAAVALVRLTKKKAASADHINASNSNDERIPAKTQKKKTKNAISGLKMTFPTQLMQILSCEEYKDIVAWTDDGMAFLIKDKDEFIQTVLHRHFHGRKYDSFIRKLYRWNFRRINHGVNERAFYNKDFMKENCRLGKTMPPTNFTASQNSCSLVDSVYKTCNELTLRRYHLSKSFAQKQAHPLGKRSFPMMTPSQMFPNINSTNALYADLHRYQMLMNESSKIQSTNLLIAEEARKINTSNLMMTAPIGYQQNNYSPIARRVLSRNQEITFLKSVGYQSNFKFPNNTL